jgi:hypothetical protein
MHYRPFYWLGVSSLRRTITGTDFNRKRCQDFVGAQRAAKSHRHNGIGYSLAAANTTWAIFTDAVELVRGTGGDPCVLPYTFVLDAKRVIHKIYNGWWYTAARFMPKGPDSNGPYLRGRWSMA